MFIEGPDVVHAMDVYTGRPLWKVRLPGVGSPFNRPGFYPGARVIGSDYVSVHDGVYVAYGETCLRLDPATGERLSEFTLPATPGSQAELRTVIWWEGEDAVAHNRAASDRPERNDLAVAWHGVVAGGHACSPEPFAVASSEAVEIAVV